MPNVHPKAARKTHTSQGSARRLLALLPAVALASSACGAPSAQPLAPATTFEADLLRTAATFAVLGASAVTNTGPTLITGDLGLSPGTAVSGFPPGTVHGATHIADGASAQGQVDLDAAWTTLKNEPCGTTLTNPELGGTTLTPGVYCFASPAATLTGALTLDSQGKADAVFVFQIASTLTTASQSSVVRINGGSGCNVFWEIGSSATLGTGTKLQGNVLASTSITATTGASIAGRLLAHTGAITLDDTTVSGCTASTTDAGSRVADTGTDSAKADAPSATPDAGHDAFVATSDAGHDAFVATPDAGHDAFVATPDAGHDAFVATPDAGCATGSPCPP